MWLDFQLVWDPKEYAGIDSIILSANEIWRPPIGHMNRLVLQNKFFIYSPLFKKIYKNETYPELIVKIAHV